MYLTKSGVVDAETRMGIVASKNTVPESNKVSFRPSRLPLPFVVIVPRRKPKFRFQPSQTVAVLRETLVGLFRRDHGPSLLLASVDVSSRGDHSQDHDVAGDELSDASDQVDSSLADIEEEVDDTTEEVENSCDQSVDERGERANDAGKKLVDRLEEVLEGGNEFSHLGCDVMWMVRLSRAPVGRSVCMDVDFSK